MNQPANSINVKWMMLAYGDRRKLGTAWLMFGFSPAAGISIKVRGLQFEVIGVEPWGATGEWFNPKEFVGVLIVKPGRST